MSVKRELVKANNESELEEKIKQQICNKSKNCKYTKCNNRITKQTYAKFAK